MSRTEARVWQRLRARQTGFHFTRQLPLGPYFADFAVRRLKLVIEIDGDQHDADRDSRRDSCLREHGWEVVRIPVTEVDDDLDRVFCWIHDACVVRQAQFGKATDGDSG